jgi:hypothetical protein
VHSTLLLGQDFLFDAHQSWSLLQYFMDVPLFISYSWREPIGVV